MRINKKSRITLKKYFTSIWSFPVILTVILIILSTLQISGSSMGVYHSLFYGEQPDKNLLLNSPLSIRSDEWIVNTQKTLAQKNNNFEAVNKNVGNGEDATLLSDLPHREWSIIFKPQNLGFLILPFDTAFALKWWMLSYFLVLSCYFFILAILPNKKLLAILLSLAFLFSPFFQWWYLQGTLATVYYGLFGITVFIYLINSKRLAHSIAWGALLSYIGVCFAMILYPPFQIPCAIVLSGFAIGHLLNSRRTIPKLQLRHNLLVVLGAVIIIAAITGLFLYQKKGIVSTIQNTAYPGTRVIKSGGYEPEHLLSSHLSSIFQSTTRANAYSRPSIGATNQSESSNFLLLLPFLIIPIMILAFYQRKVIDYTAVILSCISVAYLAWLFIPGIDGFGKLFFLDKVPHPRLLIGIGLINLMMLVVFIRDYGAFKKQPSIPVSIIVGLLVYIFLLIINFHVMAKFPAFIGFKSALFLALPFAIIVFCLMRKYFIAASLVLLVFAIFSSFKVNPLYVGTTTLTNTPISQAIRKQAGTSTKKWIAEDIYLENFAAMNGKPSLTGTYIYPQLDLWRKLNLHNKEYLYNRYAHISFTFDRDPEKNIKPVPLIVGDDQFNLRIEPCDDFFRKQNVGFLITSVKFEPGVNTCAHLLDTVRYPKFTFYIYKVTF